MGGARRSGDRDPGGEAGAGAESEDSPAHRLLAPEQMGDPVEVEPEAVGAGESGARSPAPGGEEGEGAEQGGVAFRVGIGEVEIGDEGPGVGDGHARRQAECGGFRGDCGEGDSVARAVGGGEWGGAKGRLRRFGASSHFADRWALVGG